MRILLNKKNKWVVIILVIIMTSLYACFIIYGKQDKKYIMQFADQQRSFSIGSIKNLEEEGFYFTYECVLYKQVNSLLAKTNCYIVMTNSNYGGELNYIAGGFFNDIHLEKEMNVAVISAEASINLFGAIDTVGECIFLEDDISKSSWYVVGVFDNENGNRGIDVIVPYRESEDIGISNLIVTDPSAIINFLGYNENDFLVLDY